MSCVMSKGSMHGDEIGRTRDEKVEETRAIPRTKYDAYDVCIREVSLFSSSLLIDNSYLRKVVVLSFTDGPILDRQEWQI